MGALIAVAFALQSQPALTAVSVLSHQTGNLVLKLRDHVVIDERELVASRLRPRSSCSSMQGPFCQKLTDDSGTSASSKGLVDGVLSQQLRMAHPEVFRWGLASDQKVALAVSKLIAHLTSGTSKTDLMNNSVREAPPESRSSRSRCFELSLRHLPLSHRFGQSLPADYSRGFPTDLHPLWSGAWQVVACPYPAKPATALFFGEAALHHGLCLRAGSSRLKLARSVVVRRFVIGIPDSAARSPQDKWSNGGFICGLLEGRERWCRSLAQMTMDARASKAHGAGPGMFYTDIGNSLVAVNEVALIGMPVAGVVVASVALSTAPAQWASGSQRQVVLLRRPLVQQKIVQPPGPVEGTLETISSDAAVWDADDILLHGLRLSRRVSFVDQLRERPPVSGPSPRMVEEVDTQAVVPEPSEVSAEGCFSEPLGSLQGGIL
ncbi:unnamed protein product [Symbiodinium pilosum]|uniref:Uncharacterized protein n=1 Tax=Symbiodinium pilosum TaxID=2952 RepID=A0A812T8H1_SYMPI|nr:unnamed protein product [Symbiodinium pilosum]